MSRTPLFALLWAAALALSADAAMSPSPSPSPSRHAPKPPVASPPLALPPAPTGEPVPATAPSPSDGTTDCASLAIENLYSCLDYVTGNATKPDKACCPGFSTLVNTQPLCLCQLFSTNSSFVNGLGINRTIALRLPEVCKVATPPISLCSAAGYQVGAPAPAPAGDECTTVVAPKLATCLSYVGKNATAKKPDGGCCSGFSTLVSTRPDCLCKLLANSSNILPGFPLDNQRSLALPKACGVGTLPLSACSAFGYEAPASAPSASSECEKLALTNLVPCLPYVSNSSKLNKPDSKCCSGYAEIINEKPLCLCDVIANNSTFADVLKINRNKALTLPDQCNVTTPPVSLCSAVGYEVGAPAPAPSTDKCTGVLVDNLQTCFNYVGGNATNPSKECCAGYSSLLDGGEKEQCLCRLLTDTGSVLPAGFALNNSKTFMIPSICQSKIPSCSGSPAPMSDANAPVPPSEAGRSIGSLFNVLLSASLLLSILI